MEIKKVLMVLLTVFITLFTAILLNYSAKNNLLFSMVGISSIIAVILLNFLKFKIWGYIYKQYHLSESYPLITLFFPLIYLIAILNGEATIEITKVVGVSFILVGIFIMNTKNNRI